ncbi:MAG: hypothetical protein QM650_16280, partial [Microlunatus sp.]
MITTKHLSRRRSLLLTPVAAVSCSLLLLAGCSSASSTANPSDQPSASAGARGGRTGGGQGGGGNGPGRVSGEIAAVNGKTLQIQNGESQTAVTYSSSTTFLSRVTGKVSDIEVGDCVTVSSSSTDEKATTITATSVAASPATKGECSSGGGAGGGGGGGRGARPSGTASGQPQS